MKPRQFRRYKYVGPDEMRKSPCLASLPIRSKENLIEILEALDFSKSEASEGTFTFVIDGDGFLRLAHRRSEHVICAGGEEVLSAGEMTFGWNSKELVVESVSNQSTGYCPEPESWVAVQLALERLGVDPPKGFSPEFIFRRCPRCYQTNLVKDFHFYCGVCDAELPQSWNLLEPCC
jgi:hypothetical protein